MPRVETVYFNVGGLKLETTTTTVAKAPQTFKKIMSDSSEFASNRYSIDRDGTYFRHIINYLRDGRVPKHLSGADVYQLSGEASFYGMEEMITDLKSIYPSDYIDLSRSILSRNSMRGRGIRVQKTTKRRRRK